MKKQSYILIILLLLIFQFSYALENTYPKILDYEITSKSEFVDYVSYIFAFLISISGVILIGVIIMAGIDFILAGGSPSKASYAKKRIKDGFIGLIILFFSYLILNTINPGIVDIENPDLEKCIGGGIVITIEKPDEKPKKMCIYQTEEVINIDGNITSTEWTYETGQLKEVWTFTDYNFGGKSTPLFQDIQAFSDQEIDKSKQVGSDTKSIFILLKNPGLYVYDDSFYGVEKYPPFYLGLQSFTDLDSAPITYNKKVNYSDKISSYCFIWDKSNLNIAYRAILFKDTNYSGKCSLIGYNSGSSDMVNSSGAKMTDFEVGDNAVSSVITIKDDTTSHAGKLTFYGKTNCLGEGEENVCEIEASSSVGYLIETKGEGVSNDTKYVCPKFNSDIASVSIQGNYGFVVRATDDYCQYFKKNTDNNCINLENTRVYYEAVYNYNPETGEEDNVIIRPEQIMIVPIIE